MREGRADLLLGLIGIVSGGLYAYVAAGIPKSMLSDEVGPGGVPFWVGVLVVAVSCLLVLKGLVSARVSDKDPSIDLAEVPGHWKTVIGLLVALVGYVLFVEWLGYLVAVGLLIGTVALLAGHTHSRQLYLFSIGSAVMLYLIFQKIMNIDLPKGLTGLIGL